MSANVPKSGSFLSLLIFPFSLHQYQRKILIFILALTALGRSSSASSFDNFKHFIRFSGRCDELLRPFWSLSEVFTCASLRRVSMVEGFSLFNHSSFRRTNEIWLIIVKIIIICKILTFKFEVAAKTYNDINCKRSQVAFELGSTTSYFNFNKDFYKRFLDQKLSSPNIIERVFKPHQALTWINNLKLWFFSKAVWVALDTSMCVKVVLSSGNRFRKLFMKLFRLDRLISDRKIDQN